MTEITIHSNTTGGDSMFGIDDIIGAGLKIIDKVIPDPAEKMKAQQKLMEMQQAGELAFLDADVKLALAQAKINEVEAGGQDLFKSGWRPFIGWVCGTAFAYKFIAQPFILLLAAMGQVGIPVDALPQLDWAEMSTVLMGMLGLGGYRTYEKRQGVNKR